MRLSSLKLSGFKSFADSTTLNFKANRTAVVGPNGCGKSNVIDAIRWVMGESSARQLRGGSMQDVIFTGTSKRKPVGVASVELRFDNTYGKLGALIMPITSLLFVVRLHVKVSLNISSMAHAAAAVILPIFFWVQV